MKELTPDENAAVEKVAERLAVIVGAESSTIVESLRNMITGVVSTQNEEIADDLYVDPENTLYFFSETEKYDPDKIANPEWPRPYETLVHDWRGYVPRELREAWGDLNQETREVAHYMAEKQADREVWD